MVSVTSEVLANASVQSAPARSVRPDPNPPAGNDSFASLIDSNASHHDSRIQAGSQDNSPPASQAPALRRADDSQGSTDRSRDTTSASDNAQRSNSDNRDTVNASDNANPAAKTDAPRGETKETSKSSDAKSDAKSGDAKDTTAKSAGGDTATTDQSAIQNATAAVTADAIAVTIAPPVAPATAAATPATDKPTAPLAIAAAAIAATTAVVNATAPGAATADAAATAAATATATAGKADGAKTDAQAATGEAATAQAATAEAAVTSGIAVATSSTAKPAVTPKDATPVKSAKNVKEGIATTSAMATDAPAATTADATATTAAGTPQATAAKPKAENGIADAVKSETSGNATHTANAATHGHAAPTDFTQVLANSSGNGLQGAAAIQTQQSSAITAPAATAQLTATAATGDAVPLSGVAMEIAASAKSGKTSFEIRLDPADLGRIDVRIDVDRSGQVTSHLTVEKPETLSMLRQDAPQLQRALDDAGFKTDGGGLQFSLRDQSSSGQNGGNDNGRSNAQRLVISEDDGMPAAAIAGRGYGRMLGSSSGVDIRV